MENSLRVHRDDVTALPRHQSPPQQPAPWQRRGRFLAGADRVRNGSVRLGRSGPHPAQPPLPRPEPRLLQFHLHAAVLIRGIFFIQTCNVARCKVFRERFAPNLQL